MAGRLIDLSIPCGRETPGFEVTLQGDLPRYCGHECFAYDIRISSHHGTYFETSSHVFRNGKNTDSVPLERLVLPGICLSLRKEDRCINAADLERAAGGIEMVPGAALLLHVHTRPGEEFRYFSLDAAGWMSDRKISLMGSDTPRYDSGFESPTGFFIKLFEADIPIVANIVNLETLPRDGFTLIVLPLNISGICTCPCRVVALLGE